MLKVIESIFRVFSQTFHLLIREAVVDVTAVENLHLARLSQPLQHLQLWYAIE
jgi:hypothetical protein